MTAPQVYPATCRYCARGSSCDLPAELEVRADWCTLLGPYCRFHADVVVADLYSAWDARRAKVGLGPAPRPNQQEVA